MESTINIKTPKKILHFSDGILEIYDDEEDDKKDEIEPEPELIEKDMDWSPWLIYKMSRFGKSVLEKLDYTGEILADTLGITSPKYAYEIRSYRKQQLIKANEEQKEKENAWQIVKEAPNSPITKPPTQSSDLEV